MNTKQKWILAYTKRGDDVLQDLSLHLAVSDDGRSYLALNRGEGVAFAKQDTGEHTVSRPYLFRTREGELAFLSLSDARPGVVCVWESTDLPYFREAKLLHLDDGEELSDVRIDFDADLDAYRICWTRVGGEQFAARSKSFTDYEALATADYEITQPVVTGDMGEIDAGNRLLVSEDEWSRFTRRLLPLRNTALDSIPTEILVKQGEAVCLPETVRAYYSDDSEADVPISWVLPSDLSSKPGRYTVEGRVGYPTYPNPFIEAKADPWILLGDDGFYYFTASYPMHKDSDQDGYSRVTLRRSKTIEGLRDADEVAIWTNNLEDGIHRFIWAPEIHQIEGSWYVLFTGSREADNVFGIRPHILTCRPGADPMDPEAWIADKMEALPEDTLSFTQFSLDMTAFETAGRHYHVWAEKSVSDSVLYIASFDPRNPKQLTSLPMLLTKPEFAWEQVRHKVNEGAAILKRGGRIYLAYSAAGTGPEYCIGLLMADEDADLLDPLAWTKQPYPMLRTADVPGEYGPGHNSFTKDEAGRDIFVYHARSEECYEGRCAYSGQDPLFDPCRHARIKAVHWGDGDLPILKLTEEQFIDPKLAAVRIDVVVM